MKRLLIGLILISVIIIMVVMWRQKPRYEEIPLSHHTTAQETKASDFRLPNVAGGYVTLNEFLGSKPILLYFWATWCPMCAEVRPNVEALRREINAKDLAVFAINIGVNDPLDRVVRYISENNVSLPVLYDRKGEVATQYGAFGVPLFVLINQEGNIVYWGHELPNVKKILASFDHE